MAYKVRSLNELSQFVRGGIRAALPKSDATLKQNVLYVFGKFLAMMMHSYDLRLAWLSKQFFLHSADDPAHILAHARDYNLFPRQASSSVGILIGEGSAGVTYPAGLEFLIGAQSFTSMDPATATSAGVLTVRVKSDDRGAAGNLDAGEPVQFMSSVLFPEVSSAFTVGPDGLGGGADAETVQELQARALEAKSNRRNRAALSYYEDEALSVPGVRAAWAFQFPGTPSVIGVYFLMNDRPNGIPTSADIAIMQAHLDGLRLVRLGIHAIAPTPQPINVSVLSLKPNTIVVQEGIRVALDGLFAERRVIGLPDANASFSRSWISEAVSGAAGELSHSLATPGSDIVLSNGKIAVLGDVIFA